MKSISTRNIDWIGEIPDDWNLRKIKYIFLERKEMNNPIKSKSLISLTIKNGVIPHSLKKGGGNKPKEDLSKYKIVYPGDIVINSMNVIAGAVGLSNYFGVVSPVYYMLTTKDKNSNIEYFNYLFRTQSFQKSLYGLGNGILIKENEETGKLNTIRMRISMEKLGDQFIPLPPNNEQKQITQYLHKKTKQIDSLIEKIERKIELHKERKYALINQLVTKGLDLEIDMKYSGVKFIGNIPKHWKLKRLAVLGNFSKGKNISKADLVEKGLPVILYTDIYTKYNRIFKESKSFISEKKAIESTKLQSPAFLFTSSGETREDIGKSILFKGKDNIFVGGDIVIFELKENIDLEFLSFYLNSNSCRQFKASMSRGEIVVHIYEKQIREIYICIPPLNEQIEIKKILENHEKIFEKINLKYEKKIKLLDEYRQSLISSVVTGKIRITEDML